MAHEDTCWHMQVHESEQSVQRIQEPTSGPSSAPNSQEVQNQVCLYTCTRSLLCRIWYPTIINSKDSAMTSCQKIASQLLTIKVESKASLLSIERMAGGASWWFMILVIQARNYTGTQDEDMRLSSSSYVSVYSYVLVFQVLISIDTWFSILALVLCCACASLFCT